MQLEIKGREFKVSYFLISALHGDKRGQFHNLAISEPEGECPSIYCIGGWMGPTAIQDLADW
jgi:hypothetical protein